MKNIVFFILIMFLFCACEEENINLNNSNFINPKKYLPTLQFDGVDYNDSGEQNFPQSFNFNINQDANQDGIIDIEDNLENLICFSIGDSLFGEGRTGLLNRGPNDQRPTVYFHFVKTNLFDVYQYWFYYADNNWINDHEHDWEKYFVYEINSEPIYIKISNHSDFNTISWGDIVNYDGHPLIGVDGGSHAMKITGEDGVEISYDGNISTNNGYLISGNQENIPWVIYSNDSLVLNSVEYSFNPNIFYYGDPSYLTNNNEYGDEQSAPWLRDEWINPPTP